MDTPTMEHSDGFKGRNIKLIIYLFIFYLKILKSHWSSSVIFRCPLQVNLRLYCKNTYFIKYFRPVLQNLNYLGFETQNQNGHFLRGSMSKN